MQITSRKYSTLIASTLWRSGTPAILARILAARGVLDKAELLGNLGDLVPHAQLLNAQLAAETLADLIVSQARVLIISDYDADGATACVIGLRALRAFGANVGYLVPDRQIHGYGLTPEIVDEAAALTPRPAYIVTVDNGISSFKGIERANELGIKVIVTDHHLPGSQLPAAEIVINPNQAGCAFPSKNLAGCGVIWYVMWALQDVLKTRALPISPGFSIKTLLPFTAIGTVADVVVLDRNNRILVQEGITRIRDCRTSFPGIDALAAVGKCAPRDLITTDIAFGIGPRINAAGRLKNMAVGIECLCAEGVAEADDLAASLHLINQDRQGIESAVVDEAVTQSLAQVEALAFTITVHSPAWHQGVIGIVAGRVRERAYRPTFVLADGKNGEVKGSGRSIPGFHLKDALDLVASRHEGLLPKYGGHAMAAGVSIAPGRAPEFKLAFEAVAREMLTPAQLRQVIETDGSLKGCDLTLATAELLRAQVWGQGFLEPTFQDQFTITKCVPIGAKKEHLQLTVVREGATFSAMKFRHTGSTKLSGEMKLVYKLSVKADKSGQAIVVLLVDHIEPA